MHTLPSTSHIRLLYLCSLLLSSAARESASDLERGIHRSAREQQSASEARGSCLCVLHLQSDSRLSSLAIPPASAADLHHADGWLASSHRLI
jgi:hypothetical protein